MRGGAFSFPWGDFCLFLMVFTVVIFSQNTYAHDLRGSASIQARLYPHEPLFPGQNQHEFSVATKPEYFHELDNGDLFTFIPFLRLDFADSDDARNHFDVRDLSYIFVQDSWELRVGVRQEFWGVAETTNLVDIINQIDAVEGAGATEKLGQPMVNFSYSHDWGIFDFFVMPFFREMTMTGVKGRGRRATVADFNQAEFESDDEQWHTDFALRYFHSVGKLDVGLSYFVGTDRVPLAKFGTLGDNTILIPFYGLINQFGVDLTYIWGQWLWKLEAIRKSEFDDQGAVAMVGGFEYTFSGIAETGIDLGVIAEFLYDDRGEEVALYDEDVSFGLRLIFNDVRNSKIFFTIVQDIETNARYPSVAASTLLDDNWTLSVIYAGVADQPEGDIKLFLKDDDLFQVQLTYNF